MFKPPVSCCLNFPFPAFSFGFFFGWVETFFPLLLVGLVTIRNLVFSLLWALFARPREALWKDPRRLGHKTFLPLESQLLLPKKQLHWVKEKQHLLLCQLRLWRKLRKELESCLCITLLQSRLYQLRSHRSHHLSILYVGKMEWTCTRTGRENQFLLFFCPK